MFWNQVSAPVDMADCHLQRSSESSIVSFIESGTHFGCKISVVLAGIEELGFPSVSNDITTITTSSNLMTVYSTKVKATCELFRDICLDDERVIAHQQLEWISQYNLAKAKSAVNPLYLQTNAPSLYVSQDPNYPDAIRGLLAPAPSSTVRNPEYTDNFLSVCHGMASLLENTGALKIVLLLV